MSTLAPAAADEFDWGVKRRYDLEASIGRGVYGIVWRAADKQQPSKKVAVKKVFDTFKDQRDARRTYREVCICLQLKHDNVVRLESIFGAENSRDVYLVFEYMETDLHAAFKAGILEDVHEQFVLWQILKALKYVHSARLIHRDIKPANVLLNSDCVAKICDFGLARSAPDAASPAVATNIPTADGEQAFMTDYVGSRSYRAPEILLAAPTYSYAVDVWGVGCILGHMLKRSTVFEGQSTLETLSQIFSVTGQPDPETDVGARILEGFNSEFSRQILQSLPPQPSEPPVQPEWALDAPAEKAELFRRMIALDPRERISVDEALCHSYLHKFHTEYLASQQLTVADGVSAYPMHAGGEGGGVQLEFPDRAPPQHVAAYRDWCYSHDARNVQTAY